MNSRRHMSICVVFVCLAAVSSTIYPKKAERRVNSNVQVTCGWQDSEPLTDCEFKIWLEYDDFHEEGLFLNLTQSHASGEISMVVDDRLQFWAAYLGHGLGHGECGVNMTALSHGRYFVACGVKKEGSDWDVDTMALVVHDTLVAETTDNAQRDFESFALHEKETSNPLQFSAPEPIHACQLFLPHYRPLTLTSKNPTAATLWYQAALEGGNCSVTLLDVERRATGVIWCLYQERSDAEWKAFDPIVIDIKASSRGSFVYAILILFFIASILYVCFKNGCRILFRSCIRGNGANITTFQHFPYEEQFYEFDERYNFLPTAAAGQRSL